MYEVIIVGGGPAGCAAAVYVARKKMKAMIITDEFGGQSAVSAEIENWIGDIKLSGTGLAEKFEAHVRAQEDLEIKSPERVEKIEEIEGGFNVITNNGEYQTMTVILGSGARRRKLNVPGEKEFDGRGVVYCSTCDAPLFRNKNVVVIGGGNSGLEAVQDLIPYANQITLLEYSDELKGDPVTVEDIKKSDKLKEIIFNAETKEIHGEGLVKSITYIDRKTGEEKNLEVDGVFIEIGAIPNSELVKGLVDINDYGEIIINHHDSSTSKKGIWAAGDVTDEKFKQNNISAGDGVKAALDCHQYVLKNRSK